MAKCNCEAPGGVACRWWCASVVAHWTVPPDNGATATRMTGAPREPTEAMLNAADVFAHRLYLDRSPRLWAMAWRAMWDAYQKAPE